MKACEQKYWLAYRMVSSDYVNSSCCFNMLSLSNKPPYVHMANPQLKLNSNKKGNNVTNSGTDSYGKELFEDIESSSNSININNDSSSNSPRSDNNIELLNSSDTNNKSKNVILFLAAHVDQVIREYYSLEEANCILKSLYKETRQYSFKTTIAAS